MTDTRLNIETKIMNVLSNEKEFPMKEATLLGIQKYVPEANRTSLRELVRIRCLNKAGHFAHNQIVFNQKTKKQEVLDGTFYYTYSAV